MKKIPFNDNFKCKVLPYDASLLAIDTGLDNNDYYPVSIPHDATIHDAHNFYSDYVIWYKKEIGYIPAKDKHLFIYFEGVYMEVSVYINNTLIGRNVNGYTSFFFDITDYVSSPNDELLVSIDYRCPNSRWYAGPGINRDVWLYEANDTHFIIDSLYVCPTQKDDAWELYASAEVNNDSYSKIIFRCDELGICYESAIPEMTINVRNPKLWNTDEPNLYSVTAELYTDDKLTDSIDTRIGFRDIVFTSDNGMFINGQHIKLNGVCLHSDGGCLGTAFHKDMAKRQLQLMKDMGANAIRLAHNIQAPGFLDLCDEMGLLVLNEAFDCWKREKTTYDYARFFEEWSKKDIASWIRRDRNHPSVFMWSAGNEIYDTHAGPEGKETLEYIAGEIRKHDYRNHAYITLCSNYMAWENTIDAVESIKIAGYNYGEYLYEGHHEAHPDWVIFGSETASCVQSRGVYHFPLSKSLLVDDDEHCSSLGNSTTSWGAINLDFCLAKERDTRYSLGQFYWSGLDYLGEPTPYHTKSSYFGMADTAGFPKDAFYLNQSMWFTLKEKPVLHILPYWDFNENQPIDVRICSNAPEVELFYNNESLGKKTIDHEFGSCFYADYRIMYHPGTLKAVGYDENGVPVIECCEYSFGNTDSLKLSEDQFDVVAGDRTLHFIEIDAIDADSHPVKNASDRVEISIDGPARLIGLDNGNNTDYNSFKASSMRMFNGKLLAVVEPTGIAGHVSIHATIVEHNVRKLEIITPGSTDITPDNSLIDINVKVYPDDAVFKSIEYQITNDSGVPIQNAVLDSVSEDGFHAIIRVLADAEFKVRALCRECDGRITYISQMDFSASGFGTLHVNPYTFVSGSLYSDSVGDIGNGNEKGIATSRTEDCYILYKNLDFGKIGSNTITLPIFEMDNRRTPITFWDGMPHAEDSHIIGKGIYDKKSIWNVYQEETYTLDKTLKGLINFGIELNSYKIHLKGFIFTERNIAYETNKATDAAEIYGDDYTLEEALVSGIGNNVSVVFRNMDFGPNGATRICICGKTPLDQNTIHIRFNDGINEIRQVVEFKHSEELTEQIFELDSVSGKGDIIFLFLPGSNFDFKYFRFM